MRSCTVLSDVLYDTDKVDEHTVHFGQAKQASLFRDHNPPRWREAAARGDVEVAV